MDHAVFRDHSRTLNNNLSFASCKAWEDFVQGHGPPSFRIAGTMHHMIASAILPESDATNNFLCIYFHDTTHELTNRLKYAQGTSARYKAILQR